MLLGLGFSHLHLIRQTVHLEAEAVIPSMVVEHHEWALGKPAVDDVQDLHHAVSFADHLAADSCHDGRHELQQGGL